MGTATNDAGVAVLDAAGNRVANTNFTAQDHNQIHAQVAQAGPLKEVADWVEPYRNRWEESFQRLDEILLELQKKERHHGRQ